MKKVLFLILTFCIVATSGVAAQCDITGYRTQTIGGWGAAPSGDNPGTYLRANFDAAFPDGLTIGCDDASVTFTSWKDVNDYLPAGGTPEALKKSYTNPKSGQLKNTLVSQAIALSLTLAFDRMDADFSSSDTAFGELLIAEGEFAGMTVSMMLALANDALCGEGDAAAITDAISAINENFVDGTYMGTFLTCPFRR